MFCAAMIAAAFALDDARAVIEAGLAEIPRTSRLYSEMRQVIALCERFECEFENFEAVLTEIYATFGHYNPVHTNNNCALDRGGAIAGRGRFRAHFNARRDGRLGHRLQRRDRRFDHRRAVGRARSTAVLDRSPERHVALANHRLSSDRDFGMRPPLDATRARIKRLKFSRKKEPADFAASSFLLFGLSGRFFRRLEADFGMGAIAKRLFGRGAAPAQREHFRVGRADDFAIVPLDLQLFVGISHAQRAFARDGQFNFRFGLIG